MLTVYELDALCECLGLSREARGVIETIRSSPPMRRVRSAAGNVSVRYPSRKMGVTIQAESHRVELAGLYEYEHDPQVLEFYDQPPAIKLEYQTGSGRRAGVWHTPDYFVLRVDKVGWEEWKPDVGLERLAEAMPHRYVRDAAGQWRCPPGERFAEPFGLFYRLRSSAEIDWVFQRNLRFLEDYLGSEVSPLSEHIAEAILALVGNSASAARGLGAEAQEQLTGASPADLQEANRRHAILTPHLAGMAAGPGAASARTIRRWLARWQAAERIHGCGYIGLLPHWSQRGNRRRKLPEATLTLVDEFLADDYETLKQKRKFTVYAALVRVCQERGVDAPTYKTFVKAANRRPRQERVAKRQGLRAAAQAAPFCWELSLTTPRHGDRPFELAHLDP